MSKEPAIDLKKYLVNKFQIICRKILKESPQGKKKRDFLNLLEEEAESFKEYLDRDVSNLGECIPRCKAFIEACLRIFISFFGVVPSTTFIENENGLFSVLNVLDASIDPASLYSLVKAIRISGGNKVSLAHREFVDNEAHSVLFNSCYVLELFFLGILLDAPVTNKVESNGNHLGFRVPEVNPEAWKGPSRQIDIQKEFNMSLEDNVLGSLEQLQMFNLSPQMAPHIQKENHILVPPPRIESSDSDDMNSPKKHDRSVNGNRSVKKHPTVVAKLDTKQVVVSKVISPRANSSPRNNGTKQDLSLKKEMKKEEKQVSDSEFKIIAFSECKFLPCVRKACGVSCGLNHEHSDRNKVYLSYGKIGSEACLHGNHCNKFKKMITLKDGRVCNECPFLHEEKVYDEVKKRIGLGWKLYAAGSIEYEQVFTAEKVN